MNISYQVNKPISAQAFSDLLKRSGLAERRPVNDPECIKGMVENGDLMVTAWAADTLVGVSRSVTDFHYCCYLSDLAVDQALQQQGIGRQLIELTRQQLGPKYLLILLSAPAANDYYPKIGFSHHPRCWILEPDARRK